MSIKELFTTAMRSLVTNKLRTFLTILGIIIGIMSVITLLNVGESAQNSITNSVNSFGSDLISIIPGKIDVSSITGIVLDKPFTVDDVRALEEHDALYYGGVAAMNAQGLMTQYEDKTRRYTVDGIYGDYFTLRNMEIAYGRNFSNEDSQSLARIAVIGPKVAEEYFGEVQLALGKKIRINGIPFTVIGVQKPKDAVPFMDPNEIIYVPLGTYQKLLTGDDSVQIIYANSKSTDNMEYAQREVTLVLRRHRGIASGEESDFSIQTSGEILSTINQITGIFTLFLSAIGGISLLVGGIGIMNIMFVTVRERTREIGLRKALGATNRDILLQFLTEAVVVTVLGGIIGTILGVLLTYIFAAVANLEPVISLQSVSMAVGISAAIGLVFGIYPARQASLMSPIEALRFE
ncbi:MAG: ABC transporter permease [Candidatus Dojkabacteria bacterium]|nr:MAG: ABC transporter permease [Candidatus Dojkabacteria bacterium]